jgi:hypothetical protein
MAAAREGAGYRALDRILSDIYGADTYWWLTPDAQLEQQTGGLFAGVRVYSVGGQRSS